MAKLKSTSFTQGLLPRKPTDRRFVSAPVRSTQYILPPWWDLRPGMLETSDQGSTPKCAAYALTSCLEFMQWRDDEIYRQIDPDPVYERAKLLDGEPNEAGTTLDAVLRAAQELGLISSVSGIREINVVEDVLRHIHKGRPVLCGFQITENWMKAEPNGWIRDGGIVIGGHAVAACSYDLKPSNGMDPFLGIQGSYGVKDGWRGFVRLTIEAARNQLMYALVWDSK